MTFTATVTAASGTAVPTGTVTFLDGTTTLGTGMLNGSGVATYATNALGVGGHSITASYGAVTGFSASTSMAVSVTVTAAVAPSFAVAIAPGSGTVTAGGAASATISVTAAGGFSSGVSLACAGAPANATCTVSPGSVTPSGSAAATATLTVQTNVAVMSAREQFPARQQGVWGAGVRSLAAGVDADSSAAEGLVVRAGGAGADVAGGRCDDGMRRLGQ